MSDVKIIYLDECASTNDSAKEYDGEVLVLTYNQTSGKGRLGRSWKSDRGDNIAMSLRLEPQIQPDEACMLTLVAALALVYSLPVKAKIKWPNDIVVGSKKLVGILTESMFDENRLMYVIIGIGVNVNTHIFPDELKDKATSLFLETNETFDKMEIVKIFLDEFQRLYKVFLKTRDMSELMDEYNAFLVNRGEKVYIIEGDERREALSEGINSLGELIVIEAGKKKTIRSGEVSVRGIYGYV